MRNAFRRLTPVLMTVMIGSLALAAARAADGSENGTKWRVTTSMSGLGMNLPARTTEICATGDQQDRPSPASQNKDCSFTETSHSGNTVKYAMRCTGREAMQGEGEVTYTPDHYTGHFHLKMSSGEMSMTYEGTKLGACNGTELGSKARTDAMRRQVAQQEAAVKRQMAQGCMVQARNAASPYAFLDPMKTGTVQCAQPADRAAYCAAFQSYGPFLSQMQTEKSLAGAAARGGAGAAMETPFSDSLKLCGLTADAVRAKLCARAENGAGGDTDGSTDFLVQQCPTQAHDLAMRQCAGRDYTSMPPRYRGFCANYATRNPTALPAQAGTAAGPAAQGAAADAPSRKDALENKAKSVLKGLFGR